MATIVIFVVVMLLVGSVFWIMPSGRQRQQMRIRERALAAGVRAKMYPLELPRAPGELPQPKRLILMYSVAREQKSAQPEWQLHRAAGLDPFDLAPGWVWKKPPSQDAVLDLHSIANIVNVLPKSVDAVISTPLECVLCWNEKNEQELDAIAQSLDSLKRLTS
ncbi:hypothetical protein WH50_13280 [Pokkaliibacter plantistimulans]|uniref:Preprotein translocase subunit YajC n=1 Tax=Pokkaliibacter plantistimulans TaxID=1635171 RepID=A0ABX5M079_9GAMM|nr:hypothetical protein WH50_13280 [Pokkaliibacter plantistimulans]